jgi:GNAT superfamily N-acetyltransferase
VPRHFIANGWARVAVSDDDVPIGFSVVIPTDAAVHELDGLFVEPGHMFGGVGRALVADALARASAVGVTALEVTAGPAQGFYEKLGFRVIGDADTLFGPAVRMRRVVHS